MDFLQKIESHLISDDYLIQETVLHALHDFPNVPREWTVELLKEAFRNEEKLSSILLYIDHQFINEEALQILIENIPTLDKFRSQLALKLLTQAETKLLLKYREQLEKYISKETWDFMEFIQNGTKEQVYAEFANTIRIMENEISFNQDQYEKAKKLAKCIAENHWISEDEIDAVMKEELNNDWFTYLGFLTVYMIGLLKIDKYIPVLASLLDRDEDILLEETAAALISFQSDEVVKEVGPYLKNDAAVIFATSVIENIKTDYAVQVLRETYRETEDEGNQDMMIEALCHQLSKEALPEISDHMKKEYFTNLVEIEQVVYGYFSILGEHHPDLEWWRQAAMDRELHFGSIGEEETVTKYASVNNLLSNEPIQNEIKVGRNDPCPCGSGKKYKKCCG